MTAKVFYDYHADDLDSSAIAEVFYDSYNKELFVKFHNGTLAGYSGVPVGTYETLIGSDSVGSYYSWQIRGAFDGISGDVNLVPRHERHPDFPMKSEGADPQPEMKWDGKDAKTKRAFTVLVEVTGDLQFYVDGDSFGDAETTAVALLNTALVSGEYKIVSVDKNV